MINLFSKWILCICRKCGFTGFLFSLFIEMVQFSMPMGRSVDVDDVILNTIGTFLGFITWKLLNSKLRGIPSSKEASNGHI
ncbi:VanZ family protein [Viridibacillus arvi]|uniref:VanZ family protein n=1 Tax=Viridibacillus arvi TaxID=263475 RepID=UPI001FE1BBAF|nr:VanZ family protein [Viridibacillus arvi]